MADNKFEESVKKFRASLEGIKTAQRVTCRLPDDLMEIPHKDGKRIKLVQQGIEEKKRCIEPKWKVVKVESLKQNVSHPTPQQPVQVHMEEQPNSSGSRVLVKYPSGRDGVYLTEESLSCLEPEIYLDDNIVNIMLMWGRDNYLTLFTNVVEVCNTFMYDQMTRSLKLREITEMSPQLEENFKRIHQYKRIRKPGDANMTIIPICEENHWYLLILILQKEFTHNTAVILIADSYAIEPRKHAAKILQLFVEYNCPVRTDITTFSLNVTQQRNLYDCGLHTIHNALKMMKMIGNNECIDIAQITDILVENPCPITREQIKLVLRCLIEGKDAKFVCNDIMQVIRNDVCENANNIVEPMEEHGNHKEVPGRHDIASEDNDHGICLIVACGQTTEAPGNIQLENKTDDIWIVPAMELDIITEIVQTARDTMQLSGSKHNKFLKPINGQYLSFRVWARGNKAIIMRK